MGFKLLPLRKLRRPRVDVLVRVSGLFRDACALAVERLHRVLRFVAQLDERARSRGYAKLFCCAEGAYGTGVQELLDSRCQADARGVAKKYISYGGYCFDGVSWRQRVPALVRALRRVQVVLQSQDNYEHDALDSDDYYQFEGGLNAAVRFCRSKVCAYHVDTSRALEGAVKIRSLKHELAMLASSKLMNRAWLAAMLEHGFRGGAEVIANLGYFCNFAIATTQVAASQLEGVCATLFSRDVVGALARANPLALAEAKHKLLAVVSAGAWARVSNSVGLCLRS